MKNSLRFFNADVAYKQKKSKLVKIWLSNALKAERVPFFDISYVFCSDKYLLKLNKKFLRHSTLTDIITFDNSDQPLVSGEIYISIDRVKENSEKFKVTFDNELKRVMIHGILHLCGYGDKSPKEIKLMRKKEDSYLSLWK